MIAALEEGLVLSLYPNMSGLCYSVFEGKLRTVDWGIKTPRKGMEGSLERQARWLIEAFSPGTIILPARRAVLGGSGRIQKIVSSIEVLAHQCGASVCFYSRRDIQNYFIQHGAKSKD